MQFLYSDGTDAHFMDTQTYEQLVRERAGALALGALHWAQLADTSEAIAAPNCGSSASGRVTGRRRVARTRRTRLATAISAAPSTPSTTACGWPKKPMRSETSTPDELRRFQAVETAKWKALVTQAGIPLQ